MLFSICLSLLLISKFLYCDTTLRLLSCVKCENFSPIVKSEPDENIIDLTSPVHVRMWTLDDNIIEILSLDVEFQVRVLSDVYMNFEDETALQEYTATNWQDPSIVLCIVYNSEPIVMTQQLKVKWVEVLEGLPSVWPVP